MNDDYSPVEINNIIPKLSNEKLVDFFKTSADEKRPSIKTIDFLLEELSISLSETDNEDTFLRNYIYCMIVTRKHLIQIDDRLKNIKKKQNCISDKESYPFRKLKYFEKKNENARKQIIDFICNNLTNYLSNKSTYNTDLINRSTEDTMWLLGPTYDYQYNSTYYDPEYDFSTFAKFYDIPKTPVVEFLKRIEENIALKASSLDSYHSNVKNTVDNNQLLDKMVERVEKNYHMHHRKEIFESLSLLFIDKKYLAFVVSATIQLEGMFFDLGSIKYGNKEKQGTLVEKVDKAFGDNEILKQTLYPYFAFDVPELRNQVAHKGIVSDENIEMLAYELILDLNCIVSLVEKESIDKYKACLIIKEKLDEIDSEIYCDDADYYKEISECFLRELYVTYKMHSPHFWEMIAEPQSFDDELNYYIPSKKDDDMIYLKNVVYALSNLVRKKDFWQTVLDSCEHISDGNKNELNDFGTFIEKLKNVFIPRLQGESKTLCIQVNAQIQNIKKPTEL